MLHKTTKDTFFGLKPSSQARRPMSVATEFVDTDWDEDVPSDVEDNSPRLSLQSVCIFYDHCRVQGPKVPLLTSPLQSGQPSFTTVSSYDEAPTPLSSRGVEAYPENVFKQVEGPRGPHLFRNSSDRLLADEDFVLTLSPLTPKTHRGVSDLLVRPPLPPRSSKFEYTNAELDSCKLASWTPEMVAQSMLNAGIESSTADCFIENDINGAILITLKFEDLRELGIQSFGIRTNVWHQIQALCDSRTSSPRPATPIDDVPSPEAREETRKTDGQQVGRGQSRRQRPRCRDSAEEDAIHPMDSASIIGVEQYIPKAHQCSKGKSCSRWKKTEKLIQEFKRLNPNADVGNGGSLMICGDAGNPETARAMDVNEIMRPISDAVPSVVASSDVMGPGGIPPLQYLQEATGRSGRARGPQDNVRQFLNFQQKSENSDQVPPTPPFELAPVPIPQPAHQGLRHLPKLSIPGHPQHYRPAPLRASSTVPQPTKSHPQQHRQRQSPAQSQRDLVQPGVFVPYRMEKSAALSPDLEPCRNPYRFGTPFSDMDVPVTAVPIGPVSRDASQSVPPDMNYRAASGSNPISHPRSQSQTSARRPSISVLPAVNEDASVHSLSKTPSPKNPSPARHVQQQQPTQQQKPLQAPPRFNYPWSPVDRTKFKQAIPSLSSFRRARAMDGPDAPEGVTYQGPMKKRKTRLLRNEWQDGYFTLKGTRLSMHKDVKDTDRTLEYIDIDDYAIACSSLASTSKLCAAFKAVNIGHVRKKSDPIAAFSFQLIPQDKNAGLRLRKRESFMSSISGIGSSEGVNGTGKTHHFAVTNRDDRIDWMRELMLAKAMKQKGEGFEISVNGNMI
ncbi:hypothetical protein E4U55_003919 [Claviceps digitariae]|nr:hypothetical protein E4U55_003919 [Claviceps digitariae]